MKILFRGLTPLFLLLLAAPTLAQTPDQQVDAFYQWYFANADQVRERFDQARPYLDEELYDLLQRGFSQSPEAEFRLDFDPFINAQESAERIRVVTSNTSGDTATVKVIPVFSFGEGPPFEISLKREAGGWVVGNLEFENLNLLSHLEEGLGTTPTDGTMEAGDLLGTWLHVSSSKTPDGATRPLAPIKIMWTFKAGGQGEFFQQVSPTSKARKREMNWTLAGDTIHLGGRTKYTVVRRDGDSMVWKNHRLGDFYHVQRQ